MNAGPTGNRRRALRAAGALLAMAAWAGLEGCESGERARTLGRPPESQGAAPEARGRAAHVHDGDSFTLDTGDSRIEVRLSGIDAPEHTQPYAEASRRHLDERLGRGVLALVPHGVDRYGRTLATVYADGVDVGLEQIRAGLAWHFERYARDQEPAAREAYAAAQRQARQQRTGLWREAEPLPPWTFRARARH